MKSLISKFLHTIISIIITKVWGVFEEAHRAYRYKTNLNKFALTHKIDDSFIVQVLQLEVNVSIKTSRF